MDQYAAVLLSFPPELIPRDNADYDKATKNHLNQLSRILKENSPDLISYGPQLLELLDPALNSLSYLAVLHTLIIPNLATSASREYLLEKLAIFLLSFDSIQIRYAGTHLQDLFIAVGNGQLLPPSVAVDVLATAILKLDPTGSILTSSHLLLARLAYTTDNIEPALQVLDKNIVFYPGMANRGDPKYLCEPTLPPPTYISRESGLTAVLKPQNVMEYDLLCGMIYCSRRDWARACEAFERIVTFPAREHAVSKIMVDAYKRWVFAGLLWKGAHPDNPAPLAPTAAKYYETLGKPYAAVAALFAAGDTRALRAEVEAHAPVWQEDGTAGLAREVLAGYQKWQVLRLQHVYSKISLAEVRRQTRSAETGEPLPADEDVERLVRSMIAEGMLPNGVVEKKEDGTACLAFLSPSAAGAGSSPSEKDFARELSRVALRLRELRPLLRATDDRLATHKDYIRHVVKEAKRDKSSAAASAAVDLAAAGFGFQVEVDDEDLMGGIVSTG